MLLTLVLIRDKLVLVEKTLLILEVYPSSAEGIGLENRQVLNGTRGFKSLILLILLSRGGAVGSSSGS